MKCLNCGADMPAGSVFCTNCGAKAAAPAGSCQKCQAPLLPGSLFCNVCGTPVAKQNPVCPQCAAPVLADAVFCPNCGKNLKTAAPLTQAAATAPAAVYMPPVQQVPPAQQAAWQQPQPARQPVYAPSPSFAQPYGQPAPAAKPKRKGWLVALIIVLVIAIGCGATYALAGKQIMRLVLGPKASYLAIEGKALKQNASDAVDKLVKAGNRQDMAVKGGSMVELNLDLNEANLGIEPTIAAAIENITFNTTFLYDRETDKPRYFAAVDLLAKDEKLLTLEAFIEPDQVVVGLPDILNQYIVATKDELFGYAGMTGADPATADSSLSALSQILSLDLGIDQPELQKSVYKIIDVILKYIDEAEYKGGQTLKVGSVSAQYDLYTITVSSDNMRKMFLEILEIARADEQIFNLVSKLSATGAAADPSLGIDAAGLSLDDYQAAIDEAIGQLEDESTAGTAFTLVQKIYVNGQDEVFGRDITITDEKEAVLAHLQYYHPVAGEKEALSVSFESDTETASFVATYANKNGKKTGEAVLTVNDEKIATITFTDLISKAIGSQDYPLGEITLEITGGGTALPGAITYKGWEESGKFWLELGMADYGTLKVGYQEIAASAVKFPTYDASNLVSVADTDALQGLMTEDVMNQLTAIMTELGLTPTTN